MRGLRANPTGHIPAAVTQLLLCLEEKRISAKRALRALTGGKSLCSQGRSGPPCRWRPHVASPSSSAEVSIRVDQVGTGTLHVSDTKVRGHPHAWIASARDVWTGQKKKLDVPAPPAPFRGPWQF